MLMVNLHWERAWPLLQARFARCGRPQASGVAQSFVCRGAPINNRFLGVTSEGIDCVQIR